MLQTTNTLVTRTVVKVKGQPQRIHVTRIKAATLVLAPDSEQHDEKEGQMIQWTVHSL